VAQVGQEFPEELKTKLRGSCKLESCLRRKLRGCTVEVVAQEGRVRVTWFELVLSEKKGRVSGFVGI